VLVRGGPLTKSRSEGLYDRDRGADAPAVLDDSEHHFGDAVAARFARKALDRGPVNEAAENRHGEQEPDPEPGKLEARDTSLLAELQVTCGEPCEAVAEPPESNRPKALRICT
jgi:hypothetical protein